MAQLVRIKACFIFTLFLLHVVFGSKYSEKENEREKRPFRMSKVNMLWEKAQKKLKGPVLSDLYADLVIQDKKERDLKRIRTEGSDPDGLKEAETRQAFVDIINRFDLEAYFPSEMKENKKAGGKPVIKDENLKKLWKKAALEGFSEEELAKLREEFGHQQMKLDEYEALKTEYDQLQDKVDNSVEHLDDQDELWKGLSLKKRNLKDKHTQLRERLAMLEKKAKGSQNQSREFKDSRVYHLWALAQRSNMTNEELEALKKELMHFEHRIMKHDIYQQEVQRSAEKLQAGNMQDLQRHEQLINRADEYGKKVEKYHEELKRKVNEALEHTEL